FSERSQTAMNLQTRFLASVLVVAAAPMVNGAEIALPYRQAIESTAVSIQLDSADILVVCSEDLPPSLEIRHTDPDHQGPIDLKIAQSEGLFGIIKTPETTDPLNVVLELTLPLDLPVVARGRDLRIRRVCASPAVDQASDKSPGPWTDIRASTFELEGGSVDFRGPGKAWFQGVNNDISLSSTLGEFTFVTTDGTITIHEHLGNLKLESTNSVVSIQSLKGNLDAEVSQGRLSLAEVTGETKCDGDQSSLDISNHNGILTVSGGQNDITIRQGFFQRFSLSGDNTRIRITEGSGTGTLNLVGGFLNIEKWSGRLSLQARSDADLEVSEVDGDIVLSLTDGTSCNINAVSGHTRGSIEYGDLEVSDLKSIEFSAISSSITAHEIREATIFNLIDGDLAFTSTDLKGEPRIDLKGTARAQIEIPAPCRVQLKGPGKNSANVEVQGCDLRRGNSPMAQRRKKSWETRRPINLTVKLSPETELRVDGLLY
ncbi:MAG: hypothetical protein ABFS37_00300, partial [Acidobacteriota bacterium]